MALSSFQEWRIKTNGHPKHLATDRIIAIISQAGERGIRYSDVMKAIDAPGDVIEKMIEMLRSLGEVSVSIEDGERVVRSMRKLGGLLSGDYLHHVAQTRFIEK